MKNPFPFKAIAAISEDGVIGKAGDLPWRIPGDLKWFKKITTGHTILMGRKTWDSLPGALPGRRNWVLSRNAQSEPGMKVFKSMEKILSILTPDKTTFIIGGGEIYSLALPYCRELYLTEVRRKVPDGDAFFPAFRHEFKPVETMDENNEFILRRWVRASLQTLD